MHVRTILPMTSLLVTSVALTTATASEPATADKKAQPMIEQIKGKGIIDEGIRAIEIKESSIASMMDEVRETGFLEIDAFPLPDGSTVKLKLREARPFAPDARFIRQTKSDPKTAHVEPAVVPENALILTGEVGEDADSFVMLALSDQGSFGFIQNSKGNSVISSGKLGQKLEPVIYNPEVALGGILNMTDWVCGEETAHLENLAAFGEHPPQGGLAGAAQCKVIKVALEYDYEFWNTAMNADGWVALFYTAALVGALDEIYGRDAGVSIQLSNIRIWEDPADPWTGVDTAAQLAELRDWYWDNGDDIDRDIAILCSSRSIGGGRAYLGGLCNNYGYSVCGGMSGSFPYPLADYTPGNWDLIVVAHELGHNLGTTHTHNYCPPLDQCASATQFGSCQDSRECQQGTIMSYCHTCSGGSSNIRLRFHPTVAQTISDYVASSACIGNTDATVNAYSDSAETVMNTAVTIDALHNDRATCSDVWIQDFDEVTAAGGSVRLSIGTGSFGRDELIYQPPVGFLGEDSFNYVASNDFDMLDPGPIGITVQPQERTEALLVVDVYQNAVQRFDVDTCDFIGTLIPPSEENGLESAQAVCTGPGGELLVASYHSSSVNRYNPNTGEFLGYFYRSEHIAGPNDLAFDFNHVYVSAHDAQQVAVVKASGGLGFIYPVGESVNDIDLDEAESRLYVAYGSDNFNGGIQIWNTQTHQLADSFPTPEIREATSVCRLPNGDILAGDWFGQVIARYDGATHAFEGWFLSADDTFDLGIGTPNRMELGPSGLVHLTSSSGLHRLTTNGAYLDTPESTDGTRLVFPRGLFFDLSDELLGDLNNDGRVDGADLTLLLSNWGGSGVGDLNGDGVIDGADLTILLAEWS